MLQAAAYKGSHSLLQLLIGKAKNIDIQGNIFEDALHLACIQGHMVVVEQLISVGINPSMVDEHGWTPVLCASWFGHGQIVDYLLSNGGNKDLLSPVKTIPPSLWSVVDKSTCLQLDENLTSVRYSGK
jgi:ankyrin repeat protein